MPNQLGQCGITGGPTEVLMVNENYLDTFNDLVEEILRLNQLTHDVMESIMDGCEGLCDVGITRRLNEEAYEQQSRLRNLLDYINLYAVKLKKLDCELSDRYRGILHKIVEQPAVGTTESTNDYAWDTIRRILVEERGWSETEADAALYYLQYNNPTGLSQLESFNQNGAYPAYDRQLDYLLSECDKLRTREEFVQWLLNGEEQLQINAGLRDMVIIANSQIGEQEGTDSINGQLVYTNDVIYNTEYYGGGVSSSDGDCYAWCSTFAMWCADKAGVFQDNFLDLGRDDMAGSGLNRVSNVAALYLLNNQYHSLRGESGIFTNTDYDLSGKVPLEEPNYIPSVGDYICFRGVTNHIGIVVGYDVENEVVYTVEGNSDNCVAQHHYYMNDSYIQGFCSNGGTEVTMEYVNMENNISGNSGTETR